jgi:dissimilatory sulfite reductase (desulfoviridin) alpha/beta subunit
MHLYSSKTVSLPQTNQESLHFRSLMQKLTVSLVGLMDLGTLDALKQIKATQNQHQLSLAVNMQTNLCNEKEQDKSGHFHEKIRHTLSGCPDCVPSIS